MESYARYSDRKRISIPLGQILLVASLIVLMLGASMAQAQIDGPSTALRTIKLRNGKTLDYRVELGRVPIRDGASDTVRAHMFFVAYRVPSAGKARPVTFLWNGGPGSNSAALHLESVGPSRLEAGGKISTFADTALQSTDLVFVDAIGTGFSRPATPADAEQFYQTRGDVFAFIEFVRAWRLLFAAEDAPIYVGGESWGAFRAAAVALGLEQRHIPVDGMIIISGRPGLPNAALDTTLRALRTVQQAVAASHHGKLANDLPTAVPALEAQVKAWVTERYVPALNHIDKLSPLERDEIAKELAHYIGIAPASIDRSTLIVSPRQFLDQLVSGKTLDTYDMLSFVHPQDPLRAITVEQYLRKTLGYVTDLAYIDYFNDMHGYVVGGGAVPSVNERWDFTTGFYLGKRTRAEIELSNHEIDAHGEVPEGQDTPVGAEAIAMNPAMKMFIANGRYDSQSSCASTDEILRRQQANLRNHIVFRCYNGGHMFYRNPATQVQFSQDLRAFVTDQAIR